MAGLPPTVQHAGFLVPNASDVADPKMAEPDRIDFNTVGNNRWGVIEGCRITLTGTTATLPVAGTAMVNGVLVRVSAGSATLGTGGSLDRFDLVVTDLNGTIKVVPGTPSADPVFPDPGPDVTTLAAVLCRAGVSSFDEYVIDKRLMLRDSIQTRLADPTTPLVRNINGTADLYSVDGNGRTVWATDTWVYRSAPETLHIHENLEVEGDLAVGDDITAQSLAATGLITGSNLSKGDTLPGTGTNGDLFQSTTGRIYAYSAGAWHELVTAEGAVPVGAVITSMQSPSVMVPLGWIPLDGSTVPESAATPGLFAIPALAPYISGLAPNRVLTTPNATHRVLIADFAAGAGVLGGESQVVLRDDQMPRHKHNVAVKGAGAHGHLAGTGGRTGKGGLHGHNMGLGGSHPHVVNDPVHRHAGMDFFGANLPIIAVVWGGQNKIDALFNDRSHTFSVDAFQWTAPSATGVTVTPTGSEHAHALVWDGEHDHLVTVANADPHDHPVNEEYQGGNSPVDVTGAYLTMFVYVRS
jgi:hypothetical protein